MNNFCERQKGSRARWPVRLVLFALLGSLGPSAASGGGPRVRQQKASPGLVIEEVAKGSAGERAGLEAGDVLLSWARRAALPANPEPAAGTLESPFILDEVTTEQAPRGVVTLEGLRNGRASSWEVPPGSWGIRSRPRFTEEQLALYQSGEMLAEAKKPAEARERWDAAGAAATARGDGATALWLTLHAARALAKERMWIDVDAVYDRAFRQSRTSGDLLITGHIYREWGAAYENANEWDKAEERYQKALAADQTFAPESLAVAADFHALGALRQKRGDLPSAKDFHSKALAIRERLAPRSLELALSLRSLGVAVGWAGDSAAEEGYYQRALAIREELVPGSLLVASSFNDLGVAAREREDLSTAEQFYRKALAIQERLAPESLDVASSLSNLGSAARYRGDLTKAEEYGKRALALKERLAPGSLTVAVSLDRLGNVALEQGDLEAAESYKRRGLAIRAKLAPGSLEEALSLTNLANALRDKGDLDSAEDYYHRAVTIQERLAPDSSAVATTLGFLGELKNIRGDAAAAEAYHRRAMAIEEKKAPESLEVTFSLNNLGDIARDRGDTKTAEEYFVRSLQIQRGLMPGSWAEAKTLHGLGLTYQRAGSPQAVDFLCQAVDALEIQKTRLGGSQETRAGFDARFATHYRACVEALVDAGRIGDAFHTLERFRARSLLAMLAERDLLFAEDLPADIATERRTNAIEYDRAQAELAGLNPAKDSARISELHEGLRLLREAQEGIVARMRQTSPRLASLQYPDPLDPSGAREALDAGTLLLSYSVGEKRTLLFVVEPERRPATGLSARSIPVGELELRQRVDAFRTLTLERALDQGPLLTQASALYDLLVKPAETIIAGYQRVLIVPDGPLHRLPFAALVRSGANARPRTFLVEWKPLHTVVSATVYAALKATGHNEPARPSLVAFGDPQYPLSKEQIERTGSAEVRSVLTRGFDFTPLPSSRAEVEKLKRLFPRDSTVYLGREATEERAKSIPRSVRYLHFATHGLLNERFPLDSALVLTIPSPAADGQDNGLLQAWEIFEKVRIDADLVTLSACETALGKELGGEGLVGLTRAFQYAGARSVLASLWSVSDESTGDLMSRFYSYLKAGKPKDAALRSAQVDLIRGARASHPFHWAAFELSGDWR